MYDGFTSKKIERFFSPLPAARSKMNADDFEHNPMFDDQAFYNKYTMSLPRVLNEKVDKAMKECGYQPDLSTEEIKKQMDYFCAKYDLVLASGEDWNDPVVCKKYFGDEVESAVHLAIIWWGNVRTLLHRKAIKDDDDNGFLYISVLSGSKNLKRRKGKAKK